MKGCQSPQKAELEDEERRRHKLDGREKRSELAEDYSAHKFETRGRSEVETPDWIFSPYGQNVLSSFTDEGALENGIQHVPKRSRALNGAIEDTN